MNRMKLFHQDPPITAALCIGMVLGATCVLGAVWLLTVLLMSFEGLAP